MSCVKHGWKLEGCPHCEGEVYFLPPIPEGRHDWAPPTESPYCRRCGVTQREPRSKLECPFRFPPGEAPVVSISEKVDHVVGALRSGDAGDHHCHWPGCNRPVPPAAWGCRTHWYKLPKPLRDKIWTTFRPGQEESKTPSRAYVEAAREVQAWIEEHGKAA
jgi:hypothetical protein